MATFNKNYIFSQDLAQGVHNLATGQMKVALTNTAPTTATAVYANITSPIVGTNLSGGTPFNVTTTSCTQTTGTCKLILVDLTLTATGAVGPFQYIVLYNDTPTSPADPVIGWYDYASAVTLAAGDTFTIDFDVSGGVLTIA